MAKRNLQAPQTPEERRRADSLLGSLYEERDRGLLANERGLAVEEAIRLNEALRGRPGWEGTVYRNPNTPWQPGQTLTRPARETFEPEKISPEEQERRRNLASAYGFLDETSPGSSESRGWDFLLDPTWDREGERAKYRKRKEERERRKAEFEQWYRDNKMGKQAPVDIPPAEVRIGGQGPISEPTGETDASDDQGDLLEKLIETVAALYGQKKADKPTRSFEWKDHLGSYSVTPGMMERSNRMFYDSFVSGYGPGVINPYQQTRKWPAPTPEGYKVPDLSTLHERAITGKN